MSVRISKTNSKLGIIPSVNLPPILTCRDDAPCKEDCYARKGRFRFPNVTSAMFQNYQMYKTDPDQYFREIKESINNGFVAYSYFRWHAAGDIVDGEYFERMIEIAKELPTTKFLAFTKKYEIVNEYIDRGGVIPQNINIVFSSWGRKIEMANPYSMPVAYVRFGNDDDDVIPADANECDGKCSTCLQCWVVRRGESVVFNKH